MTTTTVSPATAAWSPPAQRPPSRGVAASLAVAVAALPLLTPALPGNASPVDLPIIVAITVTGTWLVGRRQPIHLPFLLGAGLMVLGGALAALLRADPGSTLALAQDLLVFAWGATVANACRQPAVARVVSATWCYAAFAYASAVDVAWLVGFTPLTGIQPRLGGRVQGTLGDPNLAASYFVVSLFVLLAFGRPRAPAIRAAAVAALLFALVLTGSNGGVLSLIVATMVATIGWLWRTRGVVPALAIAALLICAVAVGGSLVSLTALEQRAANSVPLLRDSIGRGAESSGTRSALLSEDLALYQHTGPLGIGPSRTKEWLVRDSASYVKEAHSDYTATLVERGVIGAVGLVLLIVSVVGRSARLVVEPLRPPYTQILRAPQMLLAAVAAALVSGAFYEMLHFRHVWALLGLVAGLDLWGRVRRSS